MKKLYLIVLVSLFLTSCTAQESVQADKTTIQATSEILNPTLVPTKVLEIQNSSETSPTITPEKKDYVVSESDQQRIQFAESVVGRASELLASLGIDEYKSLGDDLSSCSIAKPNLPSAGYVVIKGNLDCVLIIVTEDDLQKSSELQGILGDYIGGNFATSNEDSQIILRYITSSEVSIDYIALVLAHESMHTFYSVNCNGQTELSCRAMKEVFAYSREFMVLDKLGSDKDPKYYQDLSFAAQEMSKTFSETSRVPNPDFSHAIKMRKYFDSRSNFQDQMWATIYWLRTVYEMYTQINGDNPEKYNQDFQNFLEQAYRSGMFK